MLHLIARQTIIWPLGGPCLSNPVSYLQSLMHFVSWKIRGSVCSCDHLQPARCGGGTMACQALVIRTFSDKRGYKKYILGVGIRSLAFRRKGCMDWLSLIPDNFKCSSPYCWRGHRQSPSQLTYREPGKSYSRGSQGAKTAMQLYYMAGDFLAPLWAATTSSSC
jgi:hypothetical protein